ncbi:MAG: N-acetylmuramoyl-L-alanine amidase [Oscillospiraceae bacterium]|nr:N-acetylmuramoyl-L-alanine amidase [Oscillospiraceae bacterium]
MLFFAACGLFAYTSLRSYFRVAEQASNLAAAEQKSILLDAGHGGEDGGAVGNCPQLEKDINLAITRKLRSMLEASGFSVVMTRDGDDFIGDNSLPTLAERKKSDMQARLRCMESHPNSIFVSIHQNHFDNTTYSGAQVFYSSNDEKSSVLAGTIQNSIVTLLQPDNERQSKAAEKTIYLMRNAKSPAVIVECGFLSNDSEAKMLCEEAYQNQMAFAIYCGIVDYYTAVNALAT